MNPESLLDPFERALHPSATATKQLTEPMRLHLGLSAFVQVRINREGEYRGVTSVPAWTETYLEEQLYWDDPFWRHPDLFEKGAVFFPALASSRYLEARRQHGLSCSLLLIDKMNSEVEISALSFNAKRISDAHFFLNELSLLRRFTQHARKELNHFFMTQDPISLPGIIGDKFFEPSSGYVSVKQERLELLKCVGAPFTKEQVALLTPKERACLSVLAEGLTMVGISVRLKLSARTVEHYLDSCKLKLECDALPELRQAAHLLSDLSLLS